MIQTGQIIEGRGGLYTVVNDAGESFILRAKNRFRREGITPLVGDKVRFTPGQLEEHGWLEEILPRTSLSIRPPVANISQLIITMAPEPMPDMLLLDKLLVFARSRLLSCRCWLSTRPTWMKTCRYGSRQLTPRQM